MLEPRWRSERPRTKTMRRAAAARARPASSSATSAAPPSAASASSRARSSAAGARSSASATPRSPRPNRSAFPAGKKAGGALTLLVEGAHAPMIQHLAPMIIERVNRFFGYPAVDRVVVPAGQAAGAPAPKPQRPARCAPVPTELGEGLREIADPELRACLESLAAQIAATSGAPSLGDADDAAHSRDQSEQVNR